MKTTKNFSSHPPIFSDLKVYKNWLKSQIKNNEKGFSHFRRRSKFLLPVSWTRKALYKEMLNEIFGDNCYICHWNGRLELAHMFYAKDSIKRSTGVNSLKRIAEALTYPERFRRLCSLCHDIFDHARRHGSREYLNKIDSLIISAKKYEEEDTKFRFKN